MTNIVLHITADESEADKEARGGRVRPFRETFMGTMLPVAKLYLFTMSTSVHEKQTKAKDMLPSITHECLETVTKCMFATWGAKIDSTCGQIDSDEDAPSAEAALCLVSWAEYYHDLDRGSNSYPDRPCINRHFKK